MPYITQNFTVNCLSCLPSLDWLSLTACWMPWKVAAWSGSYSLSRDLTNLADVFSNLVVASSERSRLRSCTWRPTCSRAASHRVLSSIYGGSSVLPVLVRLMVKHPFDSGIPKLGVTTASSHIGMEVNGSGPTPFTYSCETHWLEYLLSWRPSDITFYFDPSERRTMLLYA